jgi:hypothetical protein
MLRQRIDLMAYDWQGLMAAWNADLVSDPQIRDMLEPEVLASGWLGFPGSSEADLASAEHRLGFRFPESYRSFLAFSNGWRSLNQFIERLWSTEEVDRYAARHQDLIDAWRLGAAGGPADPDPDELATAVEISDYGDGVLLLNPRVVTREGEWEAWFFAPWIPGANRYRTFWDLMLGERTRYLELVRG